MMGHGCMKTGSVEKIAGVKDGTFFKSASAGREDGNFMAELGIEKDALSYEEGKAKAKELLGKGKEMGEKALAGGKELGQRALTAAQPAAEKAKELAMEHPEAAAGTAAALGGLGLFFGGRGIGRAIARRGAARAAASAPAVKKGILQKAREAVFGG
jgi:ElaB/YqjD/DUF883 family membrane-anchored ribosome-binding protein